MEATNERVTAEERAELSLEERLAQIAQAVQDKLQTDQEPADQDDEAYACPVDPAERAACEGCQ